MTAAVWVKAKVRRGPARVGVRGGTQLIDFKNRALVTCTSTIPCFRSATGPSTGSLVGSSLEPAAGSTSPSANTRPGAVCTCFWGLCGTLQGLVVSLWHFGWPWGSIVAPWASILTHMGYSWESFGHFGETLGLHFGTLGLHLGTLGVHVGVLWAPVRKRVEKCTKKHRIAEPGRQYFDDILSFL